MAELGGEEAGRLADCLASGMLVEAADGVVFRNDLAREAIAGEIEPLRRAALHGVALAVLRTANADPARLAHHAEATGDAEAVAEFAPIAGQQAAMRGAHRESAEQYRRALRFADHLDTVTKAELLERGAYEVYLIDHFDEAIAWLIDAVELRHRAGDVLAEGDAMRRLSTVQRCGGRRTDARDVGEQAVALLETQPTGFELAAAYGNMAMLAMNASELEVGLVAARKSLDLAAACGDRNVEVYSLNTLGMLGLLSGDERGLDSLERSLEIGLAEGATTPSARPHPSGRHRWHRCSLIDRYHTEATGTATNGGVVGEVPALYARTELDRSRWACDLDHPSSVCVPGAPLARIDAVVVIRLVRPMR